MLKRDMYYLAPHINLFICEVVMELYYNMHHIISNQIKQW